MSFIRSDEHSAPHSPDDPLYYAPPAVRSEAAHRSNATQTRSDHLPPTSSRSRFDEMREEAFAKSNRHPLELQLAHERRPRRALFAIAGGVAAAIGVAVVVALIFVNVVPKLERDSSELAVSISTPALATPAQTTPKDSQELLHGFMQFQQSQESNSPERAVSEPASAGTAKAPEKSQALLEKFIQWQQRK
ncbi:hypothetical protein [Bradyrhizobium murdochi]|uniref:hypothetical protein n=1 Tax=Bradyrhizobium murdochi TaxID=1038859 RepID=UPI0012EB23DE|nr:hypothetical protein [Bradyrhizobium murdochi]